MNISRLKVCTLVVLAGCSNAPTDFIEDIEQTYLFEVEHVNHAWGLTWHGLVIDSEGNIKAYDHGHEVWAFADNESLTEAQLAEKYGHSTRYVARIDDSTVGQQFSRIAGTSSKLSPPQYPCKDAGSLTYRAFHYDSRTGLYRPVLLRQEGDVARKSISEPAEDVAAWLRNLVSALEDAGIAPFDEGVCTP